MPDRLTLVTGATGLVGNNVVRMLLEQGQHVRVLARTTSDPRPLEGLDVEIASGDLGDESALRSACRGATYVVHAAGIVHIGRAGLDEQRKVNVEGTRRIARAAKAEAARMVHVSSTDAIQSLPDGATTDEETPSQPPLPVPYMITKREAEEAIQAEVADGLDAVIVNPGFMLGPWDWKPSSGQMLLEVASGRARLAPPGQVSVCDVRDVAAGILAARECGQPGRRYILAGENLSYLDTWRIFADVTGAPRPWGRAGPLMLLAAGKAGDLWGHISGHEPNVNSGAVAMSRVLRNYSSQRARDELGYRTRPVRQSAEDAWAWFQEHGYAKGKSRPRDTDG